MINLRAAIVVAFAVVACASCGSAGAPAGPATITVTAPASSSIGSSQPTAPPPPAAPVYVPSAVIGQVDSLMGDDKGYRLAGSLIVHEATPLTVVTSAYPLMLSSLCQRAVAAWDQATAAAIQIEVSSVDQTPGGFTLPATTRLYLSGPYGLQIAAPAPASGFVPTVCSGASVATGAAPNSIFVLQPSFMTPAHPQGDLSQLNDRLGVEALKLVSTSVVFPPALAVLACAGSGGVSAHRDLVQVALGAPPSSDACRIRFA